MYGNKQKAMPFGMAFALHEEAYYLVLLNL